MCLLPFFFYFALKRWLLLQTGACLLIQIAEDLLPRVGKRFRQTELHELLLTGPKPLPFAATREVLRYISELDILLSGSQTHGFFF